MVVNARLAGLLGPAGRGRSWTALSIEWPLPKAVNLTSAIFTFHTLTVGVAQCGLDVLEQRAPSGVVDLLVELDFTDWNCHSSNSPAGAARGQQW